MSLNQVTDFLQHRRKEIVIVKKLVTLLQDSSDYSAAKLVSDISKELPVKTANEAKFAMQSMANIVANVNSEIPDRVKSKNFEEDVLYSQLMSMTQQLLFDPKVAANVEGLVKASARELSTKVEGVMSEVSSIRDDAKTFMDEFSAVVDGKKPIDTVTKVAAAVPKMKSTLEGITTKMASLQSRILQGKDFSDFRIKDIMADFEQVKAEIPTQGMEYMFADNSSKLLERAESTFSAMGELDQWKSRLTGFKDNIASQILPGDIFKKNFSNIFKTIQSAQSSLSSVGVSASPEQMLSSLGGIGSKMSAMSGLVSNFGNAQMKTKLSDLEDVANERMESFFNDVKEKTKVPLDEFKKIGYDLKAMVKTAEKYATGTLLPQVKPIMDGIKARLDANFNTVENTLKTFKTTLNMFDPLVTTNAKAFMDSIGKIAPAARDAILQGSIDTFKKTLESPTFLTKAGMAVESLSTFSKVNKDKMTTADMNMVNVVSSYLSGEHKRAMMSMWISNISAQRSAAVKSLDSFVSSFISPIELMVQTLDRKFS